MRAETQGEFGLIAAELDRSRIDFKGHVDIGPKLAKAIEPGHQPYGGKRRFNADADDSLRRRSREFRKHPVNVVEASHQLAKQPMPRIRQSDAAMKADTPPPYPSILAAYREIIPTLARQMKDPGYHVVRPLPAGAKPFADYEPYLAQSSMT